MKKILILATTLLMCFSAFSNKEKSIIFSVDMRKAKKTIENVIGLRGSSAPLSWNETNIVLTDEDQDGIFKATVTFKGDENKTLEYKYLCNQQWESIDNRSLKISEINIVTDCWNVDLSLPTPYTFKKNGQIMDFETRMKSEQMVHGVSQIIMHNNNVDTLLNWGYRDIDEKLTVNENTIFHIGGMGQSLTAFAVLCAAEAKLLDLNQPLNQYLSSMKIEGSFTVRDLLIGKIKMNGENKPDGYEKGKPIPTLQQILNGANICNTPKLKQENEISDKPLFNIFTGLIAQQLLEDIYKKPFTEIIQNIILAPLDMKNTFVTAELSEKQCENASVGYDKKGKALKGKRLIFPELGYGGVWTTPSDYAKFISYLMKASRGEDNRLLSKDLAKAALTPENQFRALIFPKGDDGNYFGGAATGFRTQTSFNADENWLVVTFMNSYENWRVMIDMDKTSKSFLQSKNN